MSPQTQSGSSSGIGAAGAAGIGAAGIGVIGSIFAGIGQHQEGQQEQKAYDYNAQVDLDNMSDNEVANEQRYSAMIGKQATAYAAAGVDITRGSPLLMMAATAARGGVQAEQIRESGTEQATLEQYYGKLAAYRGTMSGIGTFLKGIGSNASGFLQSTGYSGGNIPSPSSELGSVDSDVNVTGLI